MKEVHFHFLCCKARDVPCARQLLREERFEWRRGASASMECAFRNACSLIQLIEHKSLIGRNTLKQTDVTQFDSLTSLSHTLRQVLVISCAPTICQFSDKRNTVYSLNLEWTSSSLESHFVTIYLKLDSLQCTVHYAVHSVHCAQCTVARCWREIVSPQADAVWGLIKAHWKSLEVAFSSGISTLLQSTQRLRVSTNRTLFSSFLKQLENIF